jgi:hypothetical protein
LAGESNLRYAYGGGSSLPFTVNLYSKVVILKQTCTRDVYSEYSRLVGERQRSGYQILAQMAHCKAEEEQLSQLRRLALESGL